MDATKWSNTQMADDRNTVRELALQNLRIRTQWMREGRSVMARSIARRHRTAWFECLQLAKYFSGHLLLRSILAAHEALAIPLIGLSRRRKLACDIPMKDEMEGSNEKLTGADRRPAERRVSHD